MLSLIVAMDENRGIGYQNKIPWFIPGELSWVAKTTKAVKDKGKKNALIMGYNTWLSIPEERRPLKDRLNIVISRKAVIKHDDVLVCRSIAEAISFVEKNSEIETGFIFGGASIYDQVIGNDDFNLSEMLVATVPGKYQADTFFKEVPEKYAMVDEQYQEYGETKVKRQIFQLKTLHE